jgi:hypothetical protein
MKWFTVVLFVVAAVALLPSPAKPDTPPCGGYQMLAAGVTISPGKGVSWEEHRVFMVNSASGATWEYVPSFWDKEGKLVEAGFFPIRMVTDKPRIDFQPEQPKNH